MKKTLLTAWSAAVIGLVLMASAGTASAGPPDLCVATGGEVRVQKGTAECEVTGEAGNVAIARGDGAVAWAGGTPDARHNRAFATGADSFALAGKSNGNVARATGDYSYANATIGEGNTATATGYYAWAGAGRGDGNTATATGDNASAMAAYGDGNTATATGDGSFACAGWGDSGETADNEDLCGFTP